MSGTVETSSPESELEMRSSASESSTQGIAISTIVYATIQRHRRMTAGTSTRVSAIGTSSTAPRRTRRNTRSTGPTPLTATLMSRYGMPQITDIATKSASPRLLTRRSSTLRGCT